MPERSVTPGAWNANAGGSTVMVGGWMSFVSCVTVPTSRFSVIESTVICTVVSKRNGRNEKRRRACAEPTVALSKRVSGSRSARKPPRKLAMFCA